jgi:hypothetical protein
MTGRRKTGDPMTGRRMTHPVRLTPRGMQIVRELRARFEQKFGRVPGSGDPLSFPAEADVSGPVDQHRFDAAIVAAMEVVGVSPAVIHAYRRTGLLVTEQNVGACSPDELRRWQAALEEYADPLPLTGAGWLG